MPQWLQRLRQWREGGELKDFRAELARGRLVGHHQRGLVTVPVERVVGSVGKAASMNRWFRYKNGAVDGRLRRMRSANRFGMCVLPPVELYQINDEYYVVDGHHRLAIALENDQREIDAYVVAYVVEHPGTTPVEPAIVSAPEPVGAALR